MVQEWDRNAWRMDASLSGHPRASPMTVVDMKRDESWHSVSSVLKPRRYIAVVQKNNIITVLLRDINFIILITVLQTLNIFVQLFCTEYYFVIKKIPPL